MNLNILLKELRVVYGDANNVERIIISSALIAAGADFAASMIPGVGIPATIIECFAVVWVMYGKICKELGIKLKENVLKLLARAALSNIAANLAGALAALAAAMFIPGASAVAGALVAFCTVYIAGLIFLRLIVQLAQEGHDPYSFSDVSEKDFKRGAKKMKVSKSDLNAAKDAYKKNK